VRNRPYALIRLILGSTGLWLLVAIIWGSQTVLGSNLQGKPVATPAAMRTALLQTLPWIPVTLAVVLLAQRFPLTRRTWKRHLPLHVAAFLVLVFLENLLVVLGYVLSQGMALDARMLLQQAGFWALMRLHVAALVYIAIAAAAQGLAYYRSSRARELELARVEGQLAQARLDALTAQIRPHFLFNTLHTIGQLWRSGRPDEADAMLDHLGALFQRVQDATSRTLVSLDEELETVAAYLAIESARFRDRLHVRIIAEESARGCAVPPLLLQPIVENAVRHGIAVSSMAGNIVVAARIEGERLIIDVDDDGPGPSGATASRGTGTGLANTRERLAQLFGEGQRLDIGQRAGRGTRVHVEIPAQPCPDGALTGVMHA
jgi:hypothetical protein